MRLSSGATWTDESDLFRRVVTMTDPLGRTTTITYPADSPNKTPLAVSTPSGRTVTYEYDLAWNKIAETLAPNTSEAAKTKFTYDRANRILSVQDPLGKITKATYDRRGRVLTHTDPLARVTAFEYDLAGNVVKKTRPDKAVEKTGCDALNRVLTSTDAAGQTTVYSYDLGGTLHGLTDAKGNAYVYAYDALNRKMRATYPDGSHEDWEYDAVGNNLTYTTRGGQQLGSVFDARNRVTDSVWSDGTPSVTRTYDAAGRLLSAQSSVSALTYIYDAANQLLSETQVVAAEGVAHTVAYSYDMDGNRSRMVAPSGLALDYAYTARNQVAAVSADGPPPIATYTYDLNGNRIQRSLENGIVTNFTYDDARQLLSVDHCTAAGSLVRLGYAYDKLGNRTSQRWEDGRVDRYGYDPLSQLIQAQYAPLGATPTRKATLARTTKYAYDPVGNRLSVTDTAGLTPASYSTNALNQYTNVDGVALGYDANGNLTSRAGWSYAYDAQNRLVSARSATSSVTLAYDARNRCVQRTVNGVAAHLAYDGWTLLEERTAAGSLAARYVHGLGTDEPLAMLRADGRTLFYHQDGLGSVSALTDETGKLVERYLYDVYGAATVVDGTGALVTGSLAGNRFLYTGREWIAEAGLYDYRNRVYSAQLGRFLQSDPVSFAGEDVNIYRYCGNNATSSIDPWGLNPEGISGTGYDRHRVNRNKKARNGDAIRHPGKAYDNNCAAGAQHETGTDTNDAPNTSDWERGDPFSSQTPEGTMLAEGWITDSSKDRGYRYPNQSAGNHTVTYAGEKNGVPYVREQFVERNGNGTSMRERPMDAGERFHEVWSKSGTQGPRSSGHSGAPIQR